MWRITVAKRLSSYPKGGKKFAKRAAAQKSLASLTYNESFKYWRDLAAKRSVEGATKRELTLAKDKILNNIESRFRGSFGEKGKGPDIMAATRSRAASSVIVKGSVMEIQIARPGPMSSRTQLPPTVSEGKTYSLWSLLREGWGRRGGKRPDNYVLAVWIPSQGMSAPYPSLMGELYSRGRKQGDDRYTLWDSNAGRAVFHLLIRHPGFRGIDWLTNNGVAYSEDKAIVLEAQKKLLRSIGRSVSKGIPLKVAK